MDFLKVAVIVLFVVLTILAIKIHPEMHQPMIIEDANFQLVRISDTLTNNIPLRYSVYIFKVSPLFNLALFILFLYTIDKTSYYLQKNKDILTDVFKKICNFILNFL